MWQTHFRTLGNNRILICKYSFNISRSQAFKSRMERTMANHALLKKQFFYILFLFDKYILFLFQDRISLTLINDYIPNCVGTYHVMQSLKPCKLKQWEVNNQLITL